MKKSPLLRPVFVLVVLAFVINPTFADQEQAFHKAEAYSTQLNNLLAARFPPKQIASGGHYLSGAPLIDETASAAAAAAAAKSQVLDENEKTKSAIDIGGTKWGAGVGVSILKDADIRRATVVASQTRVLEECKSQPGIVFEYHLLKTMTTPPKKNPISTETAFIIADSVTSGTMDAEKIRNEIEDLEGSLAGRKYAVSFQFEKKAVLDTQNGRGVSSSRKRNFLSNA
ncbi:MAG: hypothetical protein HQM09_25260 [Candidatus Riflebacteria bacterium]|nr:hypothetical protein [Candidatus Riflebacteria bacterium]